MDRYQRYKKARDAAWRALLTLDEPRLPVDWEALCGKLNVEIHVREQAMEQPHLAALLREAPEGACVTLRIKGEWHLFFRSGLGEARRRFAAAHELGHILLRHSLRALRPGVGTFPCGADPGDAQDAPDEWDYEADIFALRLLAPACVLHELGADTPGAIAALCGLPPRAAEMRAERMALLNDRNAFYGHALERRVRAHFRPFIQSRLIPAAPTRGKVIPAAIPAREDLPEEKARRRWVLPAVFLGTGVLGALMAVLLLR